MINNVDYHKKYYADNKEKAIAYSKKYYEEHKEKIHSYNMEWIKSNREKQKEYSKKDYQKHIEKRRSRHKEYIQELKSDVLTHYGNNELKCVLCGFDNPLALTIDHTNGGGAIHRKQLGGGGMKVYLWLKRNDYPKGYRTLCSNCQLIEYLGKQMMAAAQGGTAPGVVQ